MKEFVLDHSAILNILPDRRLDAHKGDFGKILLLCGGRGFTGAAALCAMGALRSGAGLVYLGVPESAYSIVASKLLEPVVFPLPDLDGYFSVDCEAELLQRMASMDAVLIGPGIGCREDTFRVVKTVLKHAQVPVVLDADGINVLSGHKDLLRERTAPTVITPHAKEFYRIAGFNCDDRIASAQALAADLGIIVLLKGHHTVITDGIQTYINPTGNPGMATGGSGDVLSGIITALIGQGINPLLSAACGAWLHGKAGDICAAKLGQYGMLPSDMLSVLPRLLK